MKVVLSYRLKGIVRACKNRRLEVFHIRNDEDRSYFP